MPIVFFLALHYGLSWLTFCLISLVVDGAAAAAAAGDDDGASGETGKKNELHDPRLGEYWSENTSTTSTTTSPSSLALLSR